MDILIVDDSLIARRVLTQVFAEATDLTVVATASNGREALEYLETSEADLLILDVNMPVMDGIEVLQSLEDRQLEIGVIMFSTQTRQGAPKTITALLSGADAYVTKPSGSEEGIDEKIDVLRDRLIPKARAVCESIAECQSIDERISARLETQNEPRAEIALDETRSERELQGREVSVSGPIEAVGMAVSTGGPAALLRLLSDVPADFPVPMFIVQHMPPGFTQKLASRLDGKLDLPIREARDGEVAESGTIWIAPGDRHMTVARRQGQIIVETSEEPEIYSCRPAADALFKSLAETFGDHLVAVVLTGMGRDGFDGSAHVRNRGGAVLVQDRETSVVWGMPRRPVEAGIADAIRSIDEMGSTLSHLVRESRDRNDQ
ncbi:MAG: chemotaxis-specific protein-glutamate methyltransferase CheB [Bradymonadaceae bacterium]